MNANPWLYFGCHQESGHYLFDARGNRIHRFPETHSHLNRLARGAFDGCIAPPKEDLYKYSFSRLGAYRMSAISWWDRTIDSRPGSSCTIFAPGMTITTDALLEQAALKFPWVFSRLPKPLELYHGET